MTRDAPASRSIRRQLAHHLDTVATQKLHFGTIGHWRGSSAEEGPGLESSAASVGSSETEPSRCGERVRRMSECRLAVRVAADFPVHEVFIANVEHSRVVGMDRRVELGMSWTIRLAAGTPYARAASQVP
jgi:hypothetical protein